MDKPDVSNKFKEIAKESKVNLIFVGGRYVVKNETLDTTVEVLRILGETARVMSTGTGFEYTVKISDLTKL
jgi:hypothetical protein